MAKAVSLCGRREFMAKAAAASFVMRIGAAECAGVCAVPGNEGRRILLGACRSSIGDVTLMRDLGYDFWEWNAQQAFNPAKDDAWWKVQKEEIARRPLPLLCCNGFFPGRFRLTGPKADHGPALDYAETILRRADEIGVKAVVFGSGGARNVPKSLAESDPAWIEKGMKQYADFCRKLTERVDDLKTVQVVIEPLRAKESNIVNFVWQGAKIVEAVNSPRLRLLADFYHMMMGNEKADSIVKAGPLIKHCHIADYSTRRFPGHDPKQLSRLKPYFDALKDIGYAGGVSCECGWGAKGDLARNLKTAIDTMRGLM